MAEDTVRLPGSSYDELKKIIIAYKHVGKDATLTEGAKLVGMDNTSISRNNGFLISIGVITAGKKKGPTEVGARLGQALEFDVEEHVSEILREICQDNDFLRNLVSSVRIRKGMELNALRAHVAYSAGLSKSASVLTGAGTVIEILKAANLIAEKDGENVATDLGSLAETSEPLIQSDIISGQLDQRFYRPSL